MKKQKRTFAQRVKDKLRSMFTTRDEIARHNSKVRMARGFKASTRGVRGAHSWKSLGKLGFTKAFAKY